MANARLSSSAAVEAHDGPAVLPEGGRPGARRLLEAAVVAFAERGYHGVSVRDLTSAVGIQGGSFYAHFATKEQLLAELLILGHEAHHAHVRDAILGAGPSAATQLREAVRANVEFQATWPLLTIVCNTELHALAPENVARVLRLRHDSGVLIAAVIERGNAEGVFHCKDTWLALSAIAAMGIRVAWWCRPPGLRGDNPQAEIAAEQARWLPEDDYSVESIADAYAEFALQIVGAA
ncbi:MAG: TetR family transcriptional regulator [Actinobacteria bacterium]|nr:TetR family transcriptional regulator [Actinomycetota bacterium]